VSKNLAPLDSLEREQMRTTQIELGQSHNCAASNLRVAMNTPRVPSIERHCISRFWCLFTRQLIHSRSAHVLRGLPATRVTDFIGSDRDPFRCNWENGSRRKADESIGKNCLVLACGCRIFYGFSGFCICLACSRNYTRTARWSSSIHRNRRRNFQ
jgi:hypothetical protein